jgi:zinc transport system ATP-binding protein
MNNLDLVTERSLLRFFAHAARDEGMTVIFVTHNVSVAAHFATHIALVSSSGAEVGKNEEILRADRLERAYGAPVAIVPLVGMERFRPAAVEVST